MSDDLPRFPEASPDAAPLTQLLSGLRDCPPGSQVRVERSGVRVRVAR